MPSFFILSLHTTLLHRGSFIDDGGKDEIDEDESVDMMGVIHIIDDFFVIYDCICILLGI